MEPSEVLARAAAVCQSRTARYGQTWRNQGWRGNLFKTRLKAERAFDALWSADPADADPDDLLDLINYAAFTYVLVTEGNRDGSWRYE